jgi:hypothetical protein
MTEPITFFVPVKTSNESNGSQGLRWLKAKKRKEAREAVAKAVKELEPVSAEAFPVVVMLTRLSAGVLDDDGLRSACKAVRDGIAEWLGVDDGDVNRLRFAYDQEKAPQKTYGVRVKVVARTRLVERLEAV